MMKKFLLIGASLAAIVLGTAEAHATFIQNSYPVVDVLNYQVVGDGTTINNTNLQKAFNAASGTSGGLVRFPCGKFKVNAQPVQNVHAGSTVTWLGSGACTILFISGAHGPKFNFGDDYATVSVRHMNIETDDTTGSYTAMTWTYTSGQSAASSTLNYLDDVNFIGSDNHTTDTQYWGSAFVSTGPSNIMIIGGVCEPSSHGTTRGTCYNIAGYGSGSFPYGIVYNFFGTTINFANIGFVYGDWIEGVTMDAVNMTGVNYGVQTSFLNTTGLDQLNIVNSQFNSNIWAIDIEDSNFNDISLTNNLFIISAGSGIKLQGVGYNIQHNSAAGVGVNSQYFADILTSFATGGIIANNNIGDLHYAFHIGAGVNSQVSLSENWFNRFQLVAGTPAVSTVSQSGGSVTSLGILSSTAVSNSGSTFTWTGSNLAVNQGVWFTGTLPSGLSANTIYYVLATGLTANNFELSTTPGGSPITPATSVTNYTGTVGGIYPYLPAVVIQGSSCQNVTATVQTVSVTGGYLISGLTLTNAGITCTDTPSVGIQYSEKFSIDPTSGGTTITDRQPENYEDFPLCNSGIQYSQLTAVNAAPMVWNSAIKGSISGGMVNAFCDGAWVGH